MRLTLFWSYYQSYIKSIYNKYPELDQQPYQYQLEVFLSDYFGWPPSLAQRFESIGHDVQILIVNAKPLQYSWARENNFEFTQNWQYEIAYEQVRRFQPDILWIGSMFNYFGEYLQRLRPFCRKIFAWIACPTPNSLDLTGIDCVLTSHTNFQKNFQQQGQASERVLPAFEPKVLNLLENMVPDLDCSFVGNLTWAHIQRIHMLKELAYQTPTQIWGNAPRLLSKGLLQKGYISVYWEARTFKSRINPSVWGMDMYRVLKRSRMTVNIHGEVAEGIAGNMRIFEVTGVGTLLLTEDAPNIKELYEPGKEIVTYSGTSNLIDIIHYYMKNPKERAEISQAGQAKALLAHSTIQRAQEVLAIFDTYLR
jgi:hypothetical protein